MCVGSGCVCFCEGVHEAKRGTESPGVVWALGVGTGNQTSEEQQTLLGQAGLERPAQDT